VLVGAEPFDAAEAKARRLIEEVVPTAALEERVNELCDKIASYPRATLVAYKSLIRGFAARAPLGDLAAIHDAAHATGAHIERLAAIAKRRRERG
jgi:enoyl-CoA hydratase/carnithine racemase